MAQLGNLLVNGVARFINNVSCNGSITAPTFIGKLQGKADSATKDGNNNIINDYYAKKEIYNDNSINLGRKKDTTIGNLSSVMGKDCTASADYSHAEGANTVASGKYAHAEGLGSKALGTGAHAEGGTAEASASYAHAEGYHTLASSNFQHVEGQYNVEDAANRYASITGWGTGDTDRKNIYTLTTDGIGNYPYGLTVGEGVQSKDISEGSMSIGFRNAIRDSSSLAVGYSCYVHAQNSCAIGARTGAIADTSFAFGQDSKSSNTCSVVMGASCHTSGDLGQALGCATTCLQNQLAIGHYNNSTTATKNSISGISTGTAFVIGNGGGGGGIGPLSNAFRVTGDGKVYAASSTINSGADYAEYFEWADENPNSEDRVGYFVSFDSNNPQKIRIANAFDDYILGIVSGFPSVIGNGDEDWQKRYILDSFGRRIEESYEYERKIPKGWDDENNERIYETTVEKGVKWKENPEYDPTKGYTPRADRKEWAAIGMLGVLAVRDDGSCEINKYCKCGANGIATKSEKGENTYRVIDRVSDNIIKVVFR